MTDVDISAPKKLKLFNHNFGLRFHYDHQDNYDVYAFISESADLGFSGVNLSAFPPDFPFLRGASPAELRAIRQHADRHSLLIDLETGGTDPQHLSAIIDIAHALEAQYLRTYTHKSLISVQDQIDVAVRNLSAVLAKAEQSGVCLLVENHEDLPARDVAEILRRLPHPSLGALYDYGNSMLFFEEPLVSLDFLAPWVRTGHMKDHVVLPAGVARNANPLFLGVPLGEGNLPIIEATQKLIEAGVDRVCFENCWAYQTGFLESRGGGVIGQGAFAYCVPPYRPEHCLPNVEDAPSPLRSELVRFERLAVNRSLEWLRSECDRASIALDRALRPSVSFAEGAG